MDRFSIVLIAAAILLLPLSFSIEGGSVNQLWNPAAAAIVLLGSFLAILISTPKQLLWRAFSLSSWLVTPPTYDKHQLMDKMISCGHAYRKGGTLALERLARTEKEPILKQALSMVANGESPHEVEKNLFLTIHHQQQQDQAAAEVYEHWAGYLPTLGIVGAVMGLMQVLSNLQQPETLGQGIATAFIATFYGIAVANLVMAPTAERLKQIIQQRTRYYLLAADTLARIQAGKNPNGLRDHYAQITV